MKRWLVILGVYMVMLTGIGFLAFSKQYFNNANDVVGQFLELKQKFNLDEKQSTVLNELMEKSADSSSGLQELATQSFHIILGAMLGFLSASATRFAKELNIGDEAELKTDGTGMSH